MTTTTTALSLDEKLAILEDIMRPMERALIGYSGGVDSAMLAVAARVRACARTQPSPFARACQMSITRPTRLARSTPSPSKSAAKLFSRRATSSACGGSGEVLTTGRVHGL